MKILMYTPRFFPDPLAGGRSASVRNLSWGLIEKGIQVDLVSYWKNGPSEYTANKLRVKRIFPLTDNKLLDYLLTPLLEKKTEKYLKKIIKSYDILHVHGPTYGFRFPPKLNWYRYKGWKKLKNKIPIVYQFRGSLGEEIRRYLKSYDRFLANALDDVEAADYVVTLTHEAAETLKSLKPELKVEVIYNFINEIFLRNYEKLDKYPEQFTVLYTGGTQPHKGYHMVLKIRKTIEKIDPTIRFKMIGTGLKKIPYEKMPQMYLSSSILLFPSIYWEGLPPSVLESLALKRPAIASAIGGIPEIITHGKNGFLVKPGDTDKIIEYILYLKNNPNILKKMGEEGRKTIIEKFSKEAVLTKFIKLYKSLI